MYIKLLQTPRGLERDYNYKPQIAVDKGIKAFVLWYKGFYNK